MGEASKRAALQLVNMECYHLTAGFFRNLPQEVETGGNPAASLFDQYNDGYIQLIVGTTVLSYVNMTCASLQNSIPKCIFHCQVCKAKRSLLDHFFNKLAKMDVRKCLLNPVAFHSVHLLSGCRLGWLKTSCSTRVSLSSLLNEDPMVMEKRSQLAKRLELYRIAQAEIDKVAWSK